jgi:adenylate cyclase
MGAAATTASARVPDQRVPAHETARKVSTRIAWAMTIAHTAGAIDVFLLLFAVLPHPAGIDPADHLTPNLITIAIYFPLSMALGMYLGDRFGPNHFAWLQQGRAPTAEERDQAVRVPLHCLKMDGGFWAGGVVLFFLVNVGDSPDLALHIACVSALGGLTTCAIAYLLSERLMQPITQMALAYGPPSRPSGPGVKGRVVLAWLTATGGPVLGLIMLGLNGVTDPNVDPDRLARSILVLSVAALVVGLGVMLVVAKSISAPLTSMRRALARVEGGDLSAEVRISDASEVGVLQSGFNSMVGGLRERDHMQDLWSRQVGEDVAAAAMADDPRLGGEVREVAVLFIDLVGSTAYSTTASPEHVVGRLNRFFAVVVDVMEKHGGWVNKFEGDAALCVFGAPADVEDASACALRAARSLHSRLAIELPGVQAGIGLSAGPVVAGWVGAERRFEYTVIGDAVNEAARLCELAKRRPELVLASCAILERAGREESARWRLGEETVLRGRVEPTRLAVPA